MEAPLALSDPACGVQLAYGLVLWPGFKERIQAASNRVGLPMNRLLLVALASVSMTAAAANAASPASTLKGHELAAQAKITLVAMARSSRSGSMPRPETRLRTVPRHWSRKPRKPLGRSPQKY